ncbi:outer membrane protein assembly factor BamB family protein [Paludisphaera mucosa]|uniref:PQQ-binding-like beta-propeller repeat protein n=1 Tax=Paludisphaera mucosa TaxID=3030827 RepID=A0ABT6FFX2_9BACT|nr:PQQ-binding-like beta-propeller repeat protein [Paludisphaera mucosa]MDG3006472.1 PQQ-binding-like beta-propeller repeat protein [Paludisphaera mucosa]
MSRRLALVWAALLLCWAGPMAHAQSALPSSVVPSRTALSRLGLERQWITVAPVAGSERILRISRGQDLLFVQTDHALLHVFEAETGRPLWSAQIGEQSPTALPISQNSYAVFATCANILTALDRNTGRVIWQTNLDVLPSSGTTADDDHLLIGLENGMTRCYSLKQDHPKGASTLRTKPAMLWNVGTGGPIRTRPLIAGRIACFGSSDGKVYVNMTHEPTSLYRISTGGPIASELGTHGTRTLLIPSADDSLYAVDVLTSKIAWTFPSGAPIDQAPVVAQDEIFVINESGGLSVIDPKNGSPRWTTATDSGKLLGASPTKVYLLSGDNDLMVVARDTGKVLLDPAATFQRAGLNLRDFELSFPEHHDDRLYLATPSGVLVCLREIGATKPRLLRDPNAKPFGYVPPEGIKDLPNPFNEVPADPNGAPADPNAAPAEPDAAPADPNAAKAPQP